MALTSVTAGDQSTAADLNQYKNHLEGASGSTLSWFMRCAASQNFVIRLSDNAAAQKFSIQDSDGNEVAAVDSNGGLTISGAFTPGTLTLPSGTAPTPTAEGEIWWDSDDDQFIVGDGTGQVAIGAGTTDHGTLFGLADDDHTIYLKEKASGGTAAETPTHDHSVAAQAGTIAHSVTTGKTANDHHNEAHTVASHSDTSGTGAELNTLTDGSNADSLHTHVIGPITVPKTADETVNSTTTFQNDNHLVFTGATNTIYAVTGIIKYSSGTTPDIKFTWTVPASGTWTFTGVGANTVGAGQVFAPWENTTTATASVGGATVEQIFSFSGVVNIAGTGGSVQLQWAQQTSDAGNTTVRDGSRITYEAIS